MNKDNRRATEAIVVAGHTKVIGSRGLHREDIARVNLAQPDLTKERVGLAVLAGDRDDLLFRLRGAARHHHTVLRIVHYRTRVVREAPVHGDKGLGALGQLDSLDGADGVERRSCLRH